MFWPLVSAGGFTFSIWVVILLGRWGTSRWERERDTADEPARPRLVSRAGGEGRARRPI